MLFPLTSQNSIRNNMPLGVQAPCSGRSYWKTSLNVCKLACWRSEVVPLIGWCWKKYVLCELLRKRCLCSALAQFHTIHKSSWVAVNSSTLLFKEKLSSDFICGCPFGGHTGVCHCVRVSKQCPVPSSPTQLLEWKLPFYCNPFSLAPFDLILSWYTTLHHLYFLS